MERARRRMEKQRSQARPARAGGQAGSEGGACPKEVVAAPAPRVLLELAPSAFRTVGPYRRTPHRERGWGGWRGTTQQRPGGGPRLHPRGDLTWACPTGCTPIRERLPRGGGPSERSRPFTGIPGPQHTHSLHFQSWAATGGWTNPSSASSSLHACAGSRIPGPLRKVDQLGLEAGKFHGGGFLQEAAQTVPSQGPCEPRWGRSAGDGVVSAG